MKLALFLLGVAVFSSAGAAAQMPSDHTSSPSETPMDQNARIEIPCDYDACALRLKSTINGWKITRGITDEEVAAFGFLRPPRLAPLVADVPDAADLARNAQQRYVRSSSLIWGGGLLVVSGVLFSVGSDMHAVGAPLIAAGIVGMAVGSVKHARNIDMISKAIWLYNRALKR
jgi:hypothetical protein